MKVYLFKETKDLIQDGRAYINSRKTENRRHVMLGAGWLINSLAKLQTNSLRVLVLMCGELLTRLYLKVRVGSEESDYLKSNPDTDDIAYNKEVRR